MNRQILLQQLRVISPLWTIKIGRKIRNHTSMRRSCKIKDTYLDLTQHHACIVGEAFDFNDLSTWSIFNESIKYRCKKCNNFSLGLNRTEPDKVFWIYLDRFITHFKDKHAKRYIKKLEVAIKDKENAINR